MENPKVCKILIIMFDFLLVLVQGVGEFLPISTSAHIKILSKIYILDFNLDKIVFLHIGTSCSILFFYFKWIFDSLVIDFFRIKSYVLNNNFTEFSALFNTSKVINRSFLASTIITSFPAFFLGFFISYYKVNEIFYNNIYLIAINFIFTAAIIFMSFIFSKRKNTSSDLTNLSNKLYYLDMILLGVSQSITLFPGISRSGITISLLLFLGYSAPKAVKLSFVFSIPLVAGALFLEFTKIGAYNFITEVIVLKYHILFTFLLGILSLYLINWIVKKRLIIIFGVYCFILSLYLFFGFL